MMFVMIKRSCLRLFVLLLSLYLLSAQNIVYALTFKADGFSVTTIDDTTFARMKGKTYKDNCTVPLSELRHVKVLYKPKFFTYCLLAQLLQKLSTSCGS